MQAYAQAAGSGSERDGGHRGRCRGAPWRPIEIVAMVLGFIVFWPIGLTILGMKIWQKKSGYAGNLGEFAQEKVRSKFDHLKSEGKMWSCGNRSDRSARGFASAGFGGARSTGNTAFDDWRSAELGRLEEERRKLEAAEREFADYIEGLRRAKDREEFDRFMNHRKPAAPTDITPSN